MAEPKTYLAHLHTAMKTGIFINLIKLNNLQHHYQYTHFHYQKKRNVGSHCNENKANAFTNLQVLDDLWAKMKINSSAPATFTRQAAAPSDRHNTAHFLLLFWPVTTWQKVQWQEYMSSSKLHRLQMKN